MSTTILPARQWFPEHHIEGWRACRGAIVDGRLWDTRELCQAYCDGLNQGRLDGTRGWP